MEYYDSIEEIEKQGIEKLRSGELADAARLLREAIQKGSQNFSSRFLLSRIMSELDRESQDARFPWQVTQNITR